MGKFILWNNAYREIANQDFPIDGISYGYIHWNGSDICVDLCCQCGYEGHYDGDYFRYYECPQCHTKYAVGQRVKLIPLRDEQIKQIGLSGFLPLFTCFSTWKVLP